MTSTFSTVINVGMLGLLRRLYIDCRFSLDLRQNQHRMALDIHTVKNIRTKMDLIDKLHFPYRVVITQHTHSYTSTAYTTPYAEWPSPEERE